MPKAKYLFWLSDEGQTQIRLMSARLTDEELAAAMNISVSTFYDWLKKHPAIGKAVEDGRSEEDAAAANREVKTALFKKAVGYNVRLEKTFKLRRVKYDKTGKRTEEKEELVTAFDEVHVPADVGAQKFWLTNRDPDNWKNRTELDGTLNHTGIEEYLKSLPEREEF